MTARLGEFELIRRLTADLPASAQTVLGVGDDCAILRGSAGDDLLVTTDTMVEDVHFRRGTLSWSALGAKALTTGLSDVAAMGGTARWAVVSLALPDDLSSTDAAVIYDGLRDQARRYAVDVVGGDVVASPRGVTVTVTVLGVAPLGLALRRSAAEPGDAVLVSGRLGDSAAGLHALQHGAGDDPALRSLVGAHQWPIPRCELGVHLLHLGTVHACIDLSDGLAGDLRHICEASGVSAVIEESALPLSRAAEEYGGRIGHDPVDWALHGGEDYELCFTMPERAARALTGEWNAGGTVPVTTVGAIEAGPAAVRLRRRSGAVEPLATGGYDHFGTASA